MKQYVHFRLTTDLNGNLKLKRVGGIMIMQPENFKPIPRHAVVLTESEFTLLETTLMSPGITKSKIYNFLKLTTGVGARDIKAETAGKISKILLNEELYLELPVGVALRLDKRVNEVEYDIDFIKNTSEIDSAQRYQLRKARIRKAAEVLGSKDSNAYKDNNLSYKVFRALEHDFKETFNISRYEDDLKKEDFEAAINFIENWYPPYTLKQEIEAKNSQENLF